MQGNSEEMQAQKYIFDTPKLPEVGRNVIKLREGNGEPPLIVLHGGLGSIHAFGPMKAKFRSALWAIVLTLDTPLGNIDIQAQHYCRKIKEQRPKGPYRLAAFSASSLILYAMALHLERSGDEIIQLSMIDHFPYVFFCPVIGLDPRIDDFDAPKARRLFHKVSIENLIQMTRRDGGGGVPKRMQMAFELDLAFNSQPTTEWSTFSWYSLEGFLSGIFDHIRTLPGVMARQPSWENLIQEPRGNGMTTALVAWLRQVKAVPTVYTASYGMHGSVPPDLKEDWRDLGARYVFPNAKIVPLHAGHYDILSNDQLIAGLQEGYIIENQAKL